MHVGNAIAQDAKTGSATDVICAHKQDDVDSDGRPEHLFIVRKFDKKTSLETCELWITNKIIKRQSAEKIEESTIAWRGHHYLKNAGAPIIVDRAKCGKDVDENFKINILRLHCNKIRHGRGRKAASCPPPIIDIRSSHFLDIRHSHRSTLHSLDRRNWSQYEHHFFVYTKGRDSNSVEEVAYDTLNRQSKIGGIRLSKDKSSFLLKRSRCVATPGLGPHAAVDNFGTVSVETTRFSWDQSQNRLTQTKEPDQNESSRCDIFDNQHYYCRDPIIDYSKPFEARSKNGKYMCEAHQIDLDGDGVTDTVQVDEDKTVTINKAKVYIGLCSTSLGCSPDDPRRENNTDVQGIKSLAIISLIDLPACGARRAKQALVVAAQEFGVEDARVRYIFLGYRHGEIRILFDGRPMYDLSNDIVQRTYLAGKTLRFRSGDCEKEAINPDMNDGVWVEHTYDFHWGCRKHDFIPGIHRTIRTRSGCTVR